MAIAIALHGLILGALTVKFAVALTAVIVLTGLAGDARAKETRAVEETAGREVGEPIMAIVSIATQHITIYDADGWTHRAPVSSGVRGRETPAGIFAVVQKNADHRSNLYDDAWMPHMQRLTWNGIALHGGPLPGYAASHGCVRMPYEFAEKLFEKTRLGMRVIVSPNDVAPVAISHPALIAPDADGIAAALANSATLDREAAEAARADTEASRNAGSANRQVALLNATLRRLEWFATRANAEIAQAAKAIEDATTDQSRASAEEAKARAAAKIAETEAQIASTRAELQPKLDAAAEASSVAKAAATRKADTAKAAKDAKLDLEPLSIYISRATQKLYVRRNTRKPVADGGEVFDASIEAPIEIRDSDRPIGTHVFTAVALSGAGFRWTAVSIDTSDGARNALDRISIPKDVLDRIAATAVPRSSIIISDEPLSAETNYRTEFVAVLRNHPQGGFVTRRPTVVTPTESANAWGGGFGRRGFDWQPGDRRRRGGQQGWW